MSNTFFITGVQRSGTTLLSFILGNHPEVHLDNYSIAFRLITCFKNYEKVLPYNLQHDKKEVLKWLIKKDYKGRLAELLDVNLLSQTTDIKQLVEKSIEQKLQQNKKTAWGDKSPNLQYYIPDLLQLLPNAKIIHIVRDGRATANSMSKRSKKNLRLSAQAWVDGNIVALVNQDILGASQFKIIRYEDLIEKSEETIKSVCDFIGISFQAEMLDLSESTLTTNSNSYVKGKLDASKLYAYQEQLSPKQLQRIENIQADLLEKLDYLLLSKERLETHQLSVYQKIRLNQADNLKQLFRTRQERMDNWQTQKVRIPLSKRLYGFLRIWSSDFLSKSLLDQLFKTKELRDKKMK
ncbi:MAG: sulfotransferase [Bacteroidota bacterium]